MTLRRAVAAILLPATMALPVTAQRTWVVDTAMGPGVDFTDIPPAIAAAAPYDRVEIRGTSLLAPTYSSFVVDKPLDVEATQGAYVFFFRVENLAAGQVARVAGLRCEPRTTSAAPADCVFVRNCAGAVLLANVDIRTRSADYNDGFRIRDAAAVAMQDCVARGRRAGLSTGGAAVIVERSGVSLVRTTLVGGDGGSSVSNAAGYDGGQGLVVLSGSVYASGCTITGGAGAWGFAHSGAGGDAVQVVTGAAATLAASTITKGYGFPGNPDGNAVYGPARVALDCVVTGALANGAALVASPPLLATEAQVAIGGTIHAAFTAPPGTVVCLAFAAAPGHAQLALFAEPVLLPPQLAVFGLGTLGASPAPWPIAVPNVPALAQHDACFQAAALLPSAAFALTPLAITRLR